MPYQLRLVQRPPACRICLLGISEEQFYTTPCKHYFHIECISTHFDIAGFQCPVCFTDIAKTIVSLDKAKLKDGEELPKIIQLVDKIYRTVDQVQPKDLKASLALEKRV